MSTRKWVPIIVGIVIFVVLVGAGLIGGLAYVVSKQVNVQNLPEGRGEEEFTRLVARFAGETPFIKLPGDDRDDRSNMKVHHELETHNTGSIKTLRVAAWKPDEGKLVQVALPLAPPAPSGPAPEDCAGPRSDRADADSNSPSSPRGSRRSARDG